MAKGISAYSRVVFLGKRLLLLLIAATIGVMVWIASDNGPESGKRIVFSGVTKNEEMQNVMLSPNYQGLDADGNPYTVIADKATQTDKDRVSLDDITADMVRKDGGWLSLAAKTGEINTSTNQVWLGEGVALFYDGYEMRTERAQIDMKQGNAYGDAPVEGQGPMGTLTADSFSVTGQGNSIRFNGSVRMTLYR